METSNLWASRTDHSLRSELHTDTSMPSVCRLRVLEGKVHVFPVGEKRCLDLGDKQDVVSFEAKTMRTFGSAGVLTLATSKTLSGVLFYGLGLTRA